MKSLSEYKDEINKCSKCGLCQGVCPVFKETGNECAVSKGKFVMLDGVLKGDLKLNKNINKYLDMCLKCGKCKNFCPSGIDICKIFETAKYEYVKNTFLGKFIFFLESKFVFGNLINILKKLCHCKEGGSPTWQFIDKNNIDASNDAPYLIPIFQPSEIAPSPQPSPSKGEGVCAGHFSTIQPFNHSADTDLSPYRPITLSPKNDITGASNYAPYCLNEISHQPQTDNSLPSYPPTFQPSEANPSTLQPFNPSTKLKLLYFPGCVGNIFPQTREILKKIPNIEIIERDFDCCGIPFLSSGNLERFEEVKKHNLELMDCDFDYILTDCASCESTLKGYFDEVRMPIEVRQLSEEQKAGSQEPDTCHCEEGDSPTWQSIDSDYKKAGLLRSVRNDDNNIGASNDAPYFTSNNGKLKIKNEKFPSSPLVRGVSEADGEGVVDGKKIRGLEDRLFNDSCDDEISHTPLNDTVLSPDSPIALSSSNNGKLKIESRKLVKFLSLGELLIKQNVKFRSEKPINVTFHKPCHLENIDFIKPLFENCENVEYIEMEGFDDCCGFAGEFALKNHKISKSISDKKAQNIINTGADYVITCCPSCILGLKQGIFGKKNTPKVLSLTEFLNSLYCNVN